MFEVIIAALVLGFTAAICPITIFFAMPFLPYIASRNKGLPSTVKTVLTFPAGIAVVFAPIGFTASFLVSHFSGGEIGWLYLAVGAIAIIMGLTVLRVIRIPFTKIGEKQNFKPFSLNSFIFGLYFGFITVGRAAPLLLSMLSIAALASPLIGTTALAIYAFCMGSPIVLIAFLMGAAGVKELASKYSQILDFVSGLLLLAIGAYYIARYIYS